MAIEYLGLSGIKGPLVVLENVKNASYDEIVEFTLDNDPKKKLGRIFTKIKQLSRYSKVRKICPYLILIQNLQVSQCLLIFPWIF